MGNFARNRSFGFTLLETLVALSVLAISLGTAYQVFSSSLRSTDLANDYAQASMYADSHLADIYGNIETLVGLSEGSYNKRYQWQLNVQPVDVNRNELISSGVINYKVELKVLWKSKTGHRSIQTMTFRLGSV